jgi:hypothetical protein
MSSDFIIGFRARINFCYYINIQYITQLQRAQQEATKFVQKKQQWSANIVVILTCPSGIDSYSNPIEFVHDFLDGVIGPEAGRWPRQAPQPLPFSRE